MKKIIGFLVVLGGVYLALTYYGGYAGEQALKQQIEASRAQTELHGYELELVSYERGFFSSQAVMEAQFSDANLGLNGLDVTSRSKIKHGPVLVTDRGMKLGFFAADSKVRVTTSDAEVNQILSQVLGEEIDQLLLVGHFDQSYSFYWSLPEVDFQSEGDRIQLAGGDLMLRGRHDQMDAKGTLELGQLEFSGGEGAQVVLTPSAMDFDMDYLDDFIAEGTVDYRADSLTIANPGVPEVVLQGIGFDLDQALVNERLDVAYAFTVDEVQGSPVATKNLRYEVQVNQMPPEALLEWQRLNSKMQQAGAQNSFAAYEAELMGVLELLLQDGLQFKTHFGADVLDGEVDMALVADYVALPGDKTLAEVTEPREYFALADADLDVRMSESVVMQTPLYMLLAEHIDTYFVKEGDYLVLRASLKGGQLTVADQPFPLDFLTGGAGGA